ncbi:MAG: hydroxymethylglutaryl-CoA reductase [Bacteroidota bacterium]|nr:hydroxymethylglutaryl-CoA reductase [Bacteroidota bacterium]
MASSFDKTNKALHIINTFQNVDQLINNINNKSHGDFNTNQLPIEQKVTKENTHARNEFLKIETGKDTAFLTGKDTFSDPDQLEGNIENFIGMSMVPTGVIGPVRVIGSAAQGDFFVPLATTEGVLVASYHRGAKACYLAGGVTSICLTEGVQRSPVFKFNNIGELGSFLNWALQQWEQYKSITEGCSRYAKLTDMKSNIEGNQLIITFEYHTGDAAGQNMVTLCTDAICQFIIEKAPVKPIFWFIESNYSGDKKATALSFSNVRGKKVTAEIVLNEKIVNEVLKTTPEAMTEYWRSSTIGVIQSGAIGAQGHYANGLTALFIATGQDVACIAEAAIGITRMELHHDGSLYASVTLPNLIVGTVGGGTSLPTQKECLELMDCYGPGKARKFAEICGAVVLAGEISIAAALSAGHFSSSHKKFGRKKTASGGTYT